MSHKLLDAQFRLFVLQQRGTAAVSQSRVVLRAVLYLLFGDP
jgi:hypothetical protein